MLQLDIELFKEEEHVDQIPDPSFIEKCNIIQNTILSIKRYVHLKDCVK